MPTKKRDAQHMRDFDREMLRSAVVSLFWNVISERRKKGYRLQELADALSKDKSAVSRWFNSEPNWTLNTVSDIAGALDLDVEIQARDRSTGIVYAPHRRETAGASVRTETDVSQRPLILKKETVDTESGNGSPSVASN